MDITEGHKRLFYVFDNIQNQIPAEMQDHPMARMLFQFIKEGKKDISRIPWEPIQQLSKMLGDAFLWVAEGELTEDES